MPKLNQDQVESLAELREFDGVKALLQEMMNCVEAIEKDVLSVVMTGSNDAELVHRKLKAEGARKLYNDLVKVLGKEKKK